MGRPKKVFYRRRKVCKFCADKIDYVDFKDVKLLQQFIPSARRSCAPDLGHLCPPPAPPADGDQAGAPPGAHPVHHGLGGGDVQVILLSDQRHSASRARWSTSSLVTPATTCYRRGWPWSDARQPAVFEQQRRSSTPVTPRSGRRRRRSPTSSTGSPITIPTGRRDRDPLRLGHRGRHREVLEKKGFTVDRRRHRPRRGHQAAGDHPVRVELHRR